MNTEIVHVRNLLEGKTCQNCIFEFSCKFDKRDNTCKKWISQCDSEKIFTELISKELKKSLDESITRSCNKCNNK